MNWSRITSADAWRGVALEAAWKIIPSRVAADVTPSWPLNTHELESVRILWPIKYEWERASTWVDPLLQGFRQYVRVERADIPQTHKGIVLIQMRIRGTRHGIAIDYSDRPNIDEGVARLCSLYFKMQYPLHGYSLENVVPGGFIPFKNDVYTYLPHVRALADQKSYRYDVYGRFGLEFAKDVRRNACSILGSQNYFHWEGSLQIKRYSLSLREIGQSKICIDLPGNGDFCFRLIDYMAVGACVIAPKHHTRLHVPLVEGQHIVYAKDDLSDLVDLCRFYLANDDARETLCRNSRSFFDAYLHRDQLAAYYLHCCLRLE